MSENAMVTRSAPAWAWQIIDATLALDAQSSAFDLQTRADIEAAIIGMQCGCEDPELEALSRQDVDTVFDLPSHRET